MTILMSAASFAARVMPRKFLETLYSSPRLAARVTKLLDVISPKEGHEVVAIGSGPIAGLRMKIEPRRQKYFWIGTFEPWVTDAIVRYGRPSMSMWDIGAFVGYLTLVMRRIAGPGHVLAIEPDPASYELLRHNLMLNNFDDVNALPIVIGAKRGRARLDRVKDRPSQTTTTIDDAGDYEVATLDDLLERFGAPSIVKMDIEGAEADALRGGSCLLRAVRPVFVLETHGDGGEDAIDQLRRANYHVERIDTWNSFAAPLIGGGAEHVLAVPA